MAIYGPALVFSDPREPSALAQGLALLERERRRNGEGFPEHLVSLRGKLEGIDAANRDAARDRLASDRLASEFAGRTEQARDFRSCTMSTREVAEVFGCGTRNVTRLAKAQRLPGVFLGGAWHFDPIDVDYYARNR